MKPKKLHVGDKVAIVSLSSGILGESFVRHELELGVKRLKEFGLVPVFMKNSLSGLDYLANHPEKRAEDLKQAFLDDEIVAVISAIGGNDSYKLIPYLASDEEFIKSIKLHPKIFMGYSDTTTVHILLNKLGLHTFYGPALLTDFAEFENEMLPYTKNAIDYLFSPQKNYVIKSSETWYDERTDFSPNAVGTKRKSHRETRGYEVINGSGKVKGKLFGGCLEVIAKLFGDTEEIEQNEKENFKNILKEFKVTLASDDFSEAILFLETSEQKPTPDEFKRLINFLKSKGLFNNIAGLLFGKPSDEKYYEQYKQILKETLGEYNFPIMINLNFGHSFPRGIIPYGVIAELDAEKKLLTLLETALD